MKFTDLLKNKLKKKGGLTQAFHLDLPLLSSICLLIMAGLVILYSAGNQNLAMLHQQILRILLAFVVMFLFAQIPPTTYQRWSPWLYAFALFFLVAVLIIGHIHKGGQRWLNIATMHFQPSEIMKLAIPMVLAWYFHQMHLPLSSRSILIAAFLILIPAFLTAKQPDLGTAILLVLSGGSVLLLAGVSWRLLGLLTGMGMLATPVLWYFMQDYQRQRVLTFLNPERDPLGAGYHIIQSKIAIGSGGIFGKGWLNGTQSHLQFLPEHHTDFIFAVCGEEFGLVGTIILLLLFLAILARGLYITIYAQDTYTRLLAGSISLTFFVSFFINIGMVTGILPVVGLPLPFISYGGTSMVTLMAGFGILMSIQTHRKLLTT